MARLLDYQFDTIVTEIDGTRTIDNAGTLGASNDVTMDTGQGLEFDEVDDYVDLVMPYEYGAELITDTTLTDTSEWTFTGDWIGSGGLITRSGAVTEDNFSQTFAITANPRYRVYTYITTYVAGSVDALTDGILAKVDIAYSRKESTYHIPTNGGGLFEFQSSDFNGSFNDISIKEVVLQASYLIWWNYTTTTFVQETITDMYRRFDAGTIGLTFASTVSLTGTELEYLSDNPEVVIKIMAGGTDENVSLIQANIKALYGCIEGTGLQLLERIGTTAEDIIGSLSGVTTTGSITQNGYDFDIVVPIEGSGSSTQPVIYVYPTEVEDLSEEFTHRWLKLAFDVVLISGQFYLRYFKGRELKNKTTFLEQFSANETSAGTYHYEAFIDIGVGDVPFDEQMPEQIQLVFNGLNYPDGVFNVRNLSITPARHSDLINFPTDDTQWTNADLQTKGLQTVLIKQDVDSVPTALADDGTLRFDT